LQNQQSIAERKAMKYKENNALLKRLLQINRRKFGFVSLTFVIAR